MVKEKKTNGDLQNIHKELKIEHHEPHWKPGMLQEDEQFLIH